jgi:phthiocerol/phenolphthiocerol synthesis type-I polyketide synthase B
MTTNIEEAELRQWLVDYLLANIGGSVDEIDVDLPLNELGVRSSDAVVLSGELSELLDRPVSPIEFWQHPTINALTRFLTTPEPDLIADAVAARSDHPAPDEPIAITGLGCRFPGGVDGPDALWRFISDGRSAIGQVPLDRWRLFDDGSPEVAAALACTPRWGSFLDEIDAFDAEFFGITPGEAAEIDPQQRLVLEVACEALENAGIPADSLRRTQTAVFVGACVSEYGFLASRDLSRVDAWTATGSALSIIANRLSYFLDLRGPSVAVDTACSSSLVAVHFACQSLRTGESALAIAAGVNLLLSPAVTRSFDQAHAMSHTGGCRAFDVAADGTVRGEGCGVVVLKRLADAVRDGDRVLAVVRGSAVNQDGRSNGLMAPNPVAQTAVLRAACCNAGVSPRDVDYVEAHGTGTPLGDPIEARALGTVYGRGRSEGSPLFIGAVKTNFGHLEAAAGVAGFIKATLAVERGHIPPNQHYETPNPHIPFQQMRLKVVAEPTVWPTGVGPRRAGVSSFGFGGTNAHVVIEQAPDVVVPVVDGVEPAVSTLVVSGKTVARVGSWAAVLADWMDGAGAGMGLAAVAHTLNHHRARHGRFATVCAADRGQAVAGLRAVAAGVPGPGVVLPHEGPCGSGVVFVYSGQGSQWAGMGRQLLADEPVFAAAVAELEPDFVAQTGFSLHGVLADGVEVTGIERVQPVLVGVQLALTALWRSYGVEPDAVIGHSMGEVSASVTAGILTAAEALAVVATRSRLLAGLSGQGAMAVLGLDAGAIEALIADYPDVGVAVYASSGQTVIAGPPPQVDAVIAAVAADDRLARRVDVDVAGHHRIVDPILPRLRAALAGLAPQSARIPMLSTVDGVGGDPSCDADYWVANLRRPVRFSRAIAEAGAAHTAFIEISPHPLLTYAISETLGAAHHHALGTLARDSHDTVRFHTALNATHTTYPPATEHPPGPHPQLPTTPWRHSRHWLTAAVGGGGVHDGGSAPGAVDVVRRVVGDGGVRRDWWYVPRWVARAASGAQAAPGGWWLVFADAEWGVEVSRGAGAPVQVYPPEILEGDLDAQMLAELADVARVVYAPPVTGAGMDVASAYRVFHAVKRLTAALVSMSSPARLFLVTRNAQPVVDGDRANPAHALLWGLGRSIALEHPEIWGALIDLDESVPAVLAARAVLAEAGGSDGEDQVVYRGGVRHVPRLQRLTPHPAVGVVLTADASHLVVGASGKIGPYLIGQLAEMGARTIVAVSRRGGGLAGCRHRLSELGARLIEVAADAADPAAMTALFDRFGADLPALEGIYLAAYAGGPVTLAQMTSADVAAMFRPKLDVAVLLHTLSLRTPVRQFVVFSSISGLLGSRWLAHYTATSTFLDALAHARRNLGLPATVVNWGLWQSLADNESQAGQVMSQIGLGAMPDQVAIAALAVAMSPDTPVQCAVVNADWARLTAAYRTRGALRIVDDLLTDDLTDDDTAPAAGESQFRRTLQQCSPERRGHLLVDHVAAQASAVMGLAPTELDPSTGFFQLGMDSLMSVTLQRNLSASLGQPLSPAVIFDYPTVDSLAAHLATLLPELADTTEHPHRVDVDRYAQATEDELLQQLSEKLGTP